jgi:hypothetical protein
MGKEDLLIDITYDPSEFSLDSTFKADCLVSLEQMVPNICGWFLWPSKAEKKGWETSTNWPEVALDEVFHSL